MEFNKFRFKKSFLLHRVAIIQISIQTFIILAKGLVMNVDPVIQFEVSQPNELDFSAGSEGSLRTITAKRFS